MCVWVGVWVCMCVCMCVVCMWCSVCVCVCMCVVCCACNVVLVWVWVWHFTGRVLIYLSLQLISHSSPKSGSPHVQKKLSPLEASKVKFSYMC